MQVNNFTIPIVSGPTEEKLDRAIKALADADTVEKNFFNEAAARGEHPSSMDNMTSEYHSTILMLAYLKWKIQGRIFNYRIHECASSIQKRGERYYIKFTHYNKHTRTLSSPDTMYKLEPKQRYDFSIVYNPRVGVGHVYELGLSPE